MSRPSAKRRVAPSARSAIWSCAAGSSAAHDVDATRVHPPSYRPAPPLE
jgi:hypothetical protein